MEILCCDADANFVVKDDPGGGILLRLVPGILYPSHIIIMHHLSTNLLSYYRTTGAPQSCHDLYTIYIGNELKLAVWWSVPATARLK